MTTVTTPAVPTGIKKFIPILGWLPNYQASWLRFDLVAGLTSAAVVTLQAMAYATIAGPGGTVCCPGSDVRLHTTGNVPPIKCQFNVVAFHLDGHSVARGGGAYQQSRRQSRSGRIVKQSFYEEHTPTTSITINESNIETPRQASPPAERLNPLCF